MTAAEALAEALSRGLDWAGSQLRAGLWRDAWDLTDGADLCAAVRWVAEAQARVEADGRPWPARVLARRVAELREVLRG